MDNTYYNVAFLIQVNLSLGFREWVQSFQLYLPAVPFLLGPFHWHGERITHQLRTNLVNKHLALHLRPRFLRILFVAI